LLHYILSHNPLVFTCWIVSAHSSNCIPVSCYCSLASCILHSAFCFGMLHAAIPGAASTPPLLLFIRPTWRPLNVFRYQPAPYGRANEGQCVLILFRLNRHREIRKPHQSLQQEELPSSDRGITSHSHEIAYWALAVYSLNIPTDVSTSLQHIFGE
jgi:hypothetical protein